jgi:hypothetical protein
LLHKLLISIYISLPPQRVLKMSYQFVRIPLVHMLSVSIYIVLYAQRVLKMSYQFLRITLVHMLAISIHIVLPAPFGYRLQKTSHAPHAILFIPLLAVFLNIVSMKGMWPRINSYVCGQDCSCGMQNCRNSRCVQFPVYAWAKVSELSNKPRGGVRDP